MQKFMTIKEASALPPAKIADAYLKRYKIRTKAFIEQAKLVYALANKKLRSGQSVHGLLTQRGVPAGSIGNARKAAEIIDKLVIPGLLEESVFDSLITFRVVRFANKVLGLDKGTTAVLTAGELARIINRPKATANDIGDILEYYHEHGVSPEQHKKNLREAAAAKAKADKEADTALKQAEEEAAQRAEEVEADDKEFDDANDDAETEETQAAEESTDTPTPEPQEENNPDDQPPSEPATATQGSTSTPPPTPMPPSADDLLDRLMEIRIDAMDLGPEDMSTILASVEEFRQELSETLEASGKLDIAA